MKKETKESKLIIIYLPNGKEVKYCTKELKSDYDLAQSIEPIDNGVSIQVLEDKNTLIHTYVGIPYYLQIF